MTAKANDTVKVHYKGTLSSGEVFDTSEGREPLEFTLGGGQIIPGFEKGVLGMAINESKTITIPSEEAYGKRHEQMVQQVPKAHLSPEIQEQAKVGMQLMSTDPNGQQRQLVVTEIAEETITVDGNHPLAGQDLTFEITLVSIN